MTIRKLMSPETATTEELLAATERPETILTGTLLLEHIGEVLGQPLLGAKREAIAKGISMALANEHRQGRRSARALH